MIHSQDVPLAVCSYSEFPHSPHWTNTLVALVEDFHRSFRNLQPRTRLYIGLGTMAWAGLGLLLSDKAEDVLRLKSTEKDKDGLKDSLPKRRGN